MSNYNIEEMARGMGFNDTYLNKLKSANQYISESSNQDRNKINAQLNQTLSDYEKERADQNKNFINEAQNAYVDYAKAINPYSTQRSQANRIGLGNSGYSESSLIGANNAYQNRYTNTKTNYDNIFANINNNIAKARETSNIELAKIAQNEQERLLENLYKFNDEYTAEKQREEEKRRWEAEREEERRRWEAEREEERRRYEEQMELQRQSATRSSSGSSRSSSGSSGSGSPQWKNGGDENYKIIQTNDDGWSKTNLQQTIRDGNGNTSNVEVFKSPEGALLFWDPVNNNWVKYGGNIYSTGGSNSFGYGNGGGFR